MIKRGTDKQINNKKIVGQLEGIKEIFWNSNNS